MTEYHRVRLVIATHAGQKTELRRVIDKIRGELIDADARPWSINITDYRAAITYHLPNKDAITTARVQRHIAGKPGFSFALKRVRVHNPHSPVTRLKARLRKMLLP